MTCKLLVNKRLQEFLFYTVQNIKPTTLHSIECQSFKENTLSAFGIKRAVQPFIIFLGFKKLPLFILYAIKPNLSINFNKNLTVKR